MTLGNSSVTDATPSGDEAVEARTDAAEHPALAERRNVGAAATADLVDGGPLLRSDGGAGGRQRVPDRRRLHWAAVALAVDEQRRDEHDAAGRRAGHVLDDAVGAHALVHELEQV